ncbi:MAG: hypothetical protein ABJH33_22820 [Rhizobiaceae bacterium]
MKINLTVEAEQSEISELVDHLLFGGPREFHTRSEFNELSPIERSKPSAFDREVMRNLYRAQLRKGMVPTAPKLGDWSHYFDPHELDENGPIRELFIDAPKRPCNKRSNSTKGKAPKQK